jgi:hypothetical protein
MRQKELFNVYNLVQITDKKENALSASLTNILINDRIFLKKFLNNLGFNVSLSETNRVIVDTEPHYPGIEEKSRIDIRIRLSNKFIIFLNQYRTRFYGKRNNKKSP